jgi:hypothetical protein
MFFVAGAGLFIAWYFVRSRSLLQKWAAANGYEILHSECRELRRGPFAWTVSGKQAVYYVRVRSHEGHERSGWVRCGSFWSGLLSDKTEVKWEDEA